MPDMSSLVGIDARVLNQHFVFLLSLTRCGKHLPYERAAIKPSIDVPSTRDLESRKARNGTKLCNQLLCRLARRFPQALCQLECKWKRILPKRNLWWLLDNNIRQIEIIFLAQDRAYTFAE